MRRFRPLIKMARPPVPLNATALQNTAIFSRLASFNQKFNQHSQKAFCTNVTRNSKPSSSSSSTPNQGANGNSPLPEVEDCTKASMVGTIVAGVAVVAGAIALVAPGGVGTKVGELVFDEPGVMMGGWQRWDWDWDDGYGSHDDPVLRDRIKKEKRDNIEVRELIFIRHGQYANMHSVDDDKMHLTSMGRKQATAIGKRLNYLFGEGSSITCLYNSNLLRARQTADIIMDELRFKPKRVESELLAEGYPCIPDPCPGSFVPWDVEAKVDSDRMERAFQIYCTRPMGGHADAPEKGKKISPSAMAAMMAPKSSVEIHVCHGNLIRFFLLRALQLPPSAWLRLSPHHSSMTWISVNKDGVVTARCFGGTGHLHPNEMTQ